MDHKDRKYLTFVRSVPLRIITVYTLLSALWIVFSDKLLASLVKDQDAVIRISILKGWLFVIVTAALLYWLIKRYLAQINRHEKALLQNEELLNLTLEMLPVGVWMIDKEGRIIKGNSAARQIWGGAKYVGPQEYDTYRGWWHESGRLIDPAEWGVARAVTKGESSLDEVIDIESFDGARKTILHSAVPIRTADQQVIGAIAVNLDITEQLRADEEIIAANEELLTINRVVTSCTSSLDLHEILERVLDEALKIVEMEGGTICLLGPDETLHLAAHRETSAATIIDLTTNQIKVGECLCGTSARDRQPLILPDREAVKEFATREANRNEDIRFHAAFPFVTGDICVGVLCVFTRTDLKPLQRRLRLLETVTAQVALAIENARLYKETMEHAATLEKKVAERTRELELANKELESFSFSVSHDLRSPLVLIDGFSQALLEDHAETLNPQAQDYLQRLRRAARRMSQMIEAMLNLSRFIRDEIKRERIDLSDMAQEIASDLRKTNPDRQVTFNISRRMLANGDARLLRVVMENLLGNAWKYTGNTRHATISFGNTEVNGETAYFVRDNGAGFDMAYANKLFGAFQRLHRMDEFEGIGIGLATAQRIIHRHGGKIWAEAEVGKGATFCFTLGSPEKAFVPEVTDEPRVNSTTQSATPRIAID